MSKKDIYTIVIVGIIAFALYFFFGRNINVNSEIAEVYYKDQVIDEIDLNKNDIYEYSGSYGKFSIEVENGKYHAINVDCPNHDCEKVGWVSKGSSTQIVCLPNEIFVVQPNTIDIEQ